MINRLNFIFLLLYKYRAKHLSIFFISTLTLFVLSSILFVADSIEKDLQKTLDSQADFTLQRFKAGKVLDTPSNWIDQFLVIDGVSSAEGRIYGMHYYEPMETYFMVVGVDFFDTQVTQSMKTLVKNLDVDKFLERKNMIIGAGVKRFLDEYHYFKYYIFRPPNRGKEKVYIYDSFDKDSGIITSDMVVVEKELARKILGVEDGYVTDIILEVKNKDEMQNIKEKLIMSHFDMRIIEKKDIQTYYKNLFNYKSGVFLALFMSSFFTFLLILYQRYSMVSYVDAKEIALLRMVGWSIRDVISLKLSENLIVAISAYLSGSIIAYLYVYIFDAPLIKDIFLGYSNLDSCVTFGYTPDISMLVLICFTFVIPFILSVIIPVYRVSITEPSEVMR